MPQTPAQIAEFLEKLDTDDDFRDDLINNSAQVFDDYGIPYDPDELPDPADVVLPAKGDVAANYDDYKALIFPNNEFGRHDHLLELNPN